MNDGCLFSRRPAWSAGILASHNMGTNDAPVRLRRTDAYRTLIDKMQRHARHVELFLLSRECIISWEEAGSSAAGCLEAWQACLA